VEEIGNMDEDKSKLFKEALASEGQQDNGKHRINVKKVTFLFRTVISGFFYGKYRRLCLLVAHSKGSLLS